MTKHFLHRSALFSLPQLIAALMVAPIACSPDSGDDDVSSTGDATSDGDTGDTGTSTGTGDGEDDLAWFPCPDGFVSHCARVPVPLDWNAPDGEQIEVFISKLPANDEPATRQVWLLQGGPGGSGDVFSGIAQQLRNAGGDLDVYVLEHRGVGESTRLECPVQEAAGSEGGYGITLNEMPACIDALRQTWGPGLDAMTTTNAAYDLAHVIERTAAPDQEVYVYGVSYGVWWALRYLQIDPDTANGVVLDSLPAPGEQWLSDYDKQFDPVFTDLLGFCASDATCNEKLGPDAWTRVRGVADALATGHCPDLELDAATLRQLGAILLMIDPLRKHLAPLFYRIERCDPGDVAVVANYFTTFLELLAPDDAPRSRNSIPLQFHIGLSEIWELPSPPLDELLALCESKVLCPYTGVTLGSQFDAWPRYSEPLAGQWPVTSVPVLSLNGELDPQTPYQTAATVAQHLNGPHQTYVQVPYAPHGVITASPVHTPGDPACGMQMINGFLADPLASVDTACLTDLVPADLTDTTSLATLFFGGDPWENEDRTQGPVIAPEWSRVVEVLRRRSPIELHQRLLAIGG